RMKLVIVAGSALALAWAGACFPPEATAQTRAGVRGKVVDEEGKGVEGVTIEMEFKGESRQKIVKSQLTDKKGGFVRMGLPDGKWQFTFSKEGYKTYSMEMVLSLGGFSEAPDIVLTRGATPAAAAPAGAPVAAVLPATPESSKAGETYTKAVEAAQAGRYDEAKPMLEAILAQFPN